MKIEQREAKSIIVKSNIPGIDYVINPYTGCQHACIYCYAEFMIRFTNHKGEKWGDFLDVKIFDFDKIKPEKYNGKTLLFSSVTDPYIPLELKFKNTRRILEKLKDSDAHISILTKSKFAERDIELFKEFKNIEVGISISTLDDGFARILEPLASKPSERLALVKKLHQNNINNYIFISPFFPEITDYREIITQSKNYTDYYMFENLNFRPHNIGRINRIIKKYKPNLIETYNCFRNNLSHWEIIENEIQEYCKRKDLECLIEFHHGGFSK